jgi:hypothetical protein
LLSVELGHEVVTHLGEQVIEGVVVDLARYDLVLDLLHGDGFLAASLDKESDLVVLGRDV